jgi:hypothetical protein
VAFIIIQGIPTEGSKGDQTETETNADLTSTKDIHRTYIIFGISGIFIHGQFQ